MVEIFGRIRNNRVENGNRVTTFIIPAFREGLARRRARRNSQIKGFSNVEVVESEAEGSGDIPGQTNYRVVVRSTLS